MWLAERARRCCPPAHCRRIRHRLHRFSGASGRQRPGVLRLGANQLAFIVECRAFGEGSQWTGKSDCLPAHVAIEAVDLASKVVSETGGVFGGQAGYNWQYASVVGGVEVDFSGADLTRSSTFETGVRVVTLHSTDVKIDELASARGRLGYALFPGILAYGTAGIGWGHSRLTIDDASSNVNNFGWVAGAGLEYKLVEHLFLRAEYLHYEFAKDSFFGGDVNAKERVDVVRGALSYKF